MLANVTSTSVLANAGSAHHHETHTVHIIMQHMQLQCATHHHSTHRLMKHTLGAEHHITHYSKIKKCQIDK